MRAWSGDVSSRRAVPLLLLAAAAVCVLVGLRLLPDVAVPADLGRRPAVIVNDGASDVLVSRCAATCSGEGERTALAPGRDLRAGLPGGAAWLVEDSRGRRMGCLTATGAGERLPVSRAGPCPG